MLPLDNKLVVIFFPTVTAPLRMFSSHKITGHMKTGSSIFHQRVHNFKLAHPDHGGGAGMGTCRSDDVQ